MSIVSRFFYLSLKEKKPKIIMNISNPDRKIQLNELLVLHREKILPNLC